MYILVQKNMRQGEKVGNILLNLIGRVSGSCLVLRSEGREFKTRSEYQRLAALTKTVRQYAETESKMAPQYTKYILFKIYTFYSKYIHFYNLVFSIYFLMIRVFLYYIFIQ